jgi:hypothetical protein
VDPTERSVSTISFFAHYYCPTNLSSTPGTSDALNDAVGAVPWVPFSATAALMAKDVCSPAVMHVIVALENDGHAPPGASETNVTVPADADQLLNVVPDT